MPKIIIDAAHCKGCRLCVAFCPKGAIVMSSGFNDRGLNPAQVIDQSVCSGCLNCTVMCPDAAITIIPDDK